MSSRNFYLGNKGYTLLKNDLTQKEIEFIKEKLTVRPMVKGSPIVPPAFPIYRESVNKFYVPRYFGEKHFGKPIVQIPDGDDIPIEFAGDLRDYQKHIVKTYVDSVGDCGGGLLDIGCGQGKTVMGLNIISKLRKKTLVIVHKEFLMNQWIERIAQFLPTAKIGKIQGKVFDVDGKDIVIGMLQSLSMKDYPCSAFASFGLTIVDEVHHISSEVFSCALYKIVTKYMLGLSATMDRKDGLTHVFKMFLGDIVYKAEKTNEHRVTVRAIEYVSGDSDFERVVVDRRGEISYSSMISKLCDYTLRSKFIVRVVADLFEEDPARQIMILAHNRCLLTYLHDAIAREGIATVGYYVGGMKESALKETETKQVVIATYSMAAEALDIKTLSTLIMATPKTDIEQAVGRILRVKHGSPVVVDILDTHECFKKQWAKRRQYYKKCNYDIMYIEHPDYTGMTEFDKWKRVFTASVADDSGDSGDEGAAPAPKKCLIKLTTR